jgi:hypothetical protein
MPNREKLLMRVNRKYLIGGALTAAAIISVAALLAIWGLMTSWSRDEQCPVCRSSEHVVPILYGLIRSSPENPLPRCKLGGCVVVQGKSPKWHCAGCGHEWDVSLPGEPWWIGRLRGLMLALCSGVFVFYLVVQFPWVSQRNPAASTQATGKPSDVS